MNELVISVSIEISVMLEAVASDICEHFYSTRRPCSQCAAASKNWRFLDEKRRFFRRAHDFWATSVTPRLFSRCLNRLRPGRDAFAVRWPRWALARGCNRRATDRHHQMGLDMTRKDIDCRVPGALGAARLVLAGRS